ncbi:MAG: hypothetical protein K2J20_06325, partial [Bacilli bacterium]|nr:hypothetical protein [Bacilli bacterium]
MEFSDEEVLALALADNEDAKNIIYEKYKYIVDIMLRKHSSNALKLNVDMHELELEAYYAFSDALVSFRNDKNATLGTFITLCIDRRLKKIIKRANGEKAKLLNNTFSLDYDYDEEGSTLKDFLSDGLQNDPLYNLTNEENYEELVTKIKNSLSHGEYEVFN